MDSYICEISKQAPYILTTEVGGFTARLIINGQKDITLNVAVKLELALGVKKSFWLNCQAIFDGALAMLRERDSITEEERSIQRQLECSGIAGYIRARLGHTSRGIPDNELMDLREGLRVSSLVQLSELVPKTVRVESGTLDLYSLGALISISQEAQKARGNSSTSVTSMEDLKAHLRELMSQEASLLWLFCRQS